MMSRISDKMSKLLQKIGLNEDEKAIFIFLNMVGTSSPLKISKAVNIPRTSVYRSLESLQELGLIIEEQGRSGKIFKLAPSERWNILLAKKEAELLEIRSTLPQLSRLTNESGVKLGKIQTNIYKGKVGLENALWGTLKQESHLFTFITDDLNKFLGKKFAETWRKELAVRDIKLKELTNEEQVDSFSNEEKFIQDCWEIRYVKPSQLSIIANVFISEESLVYINITDGMESAVEIINQDMVNMQRSFFELAWDIAEPMLRVDAQGKSILVQRDI